ncbi:hypothetical protein [Thioclava sp. DLFJ4-1]|nr:hypothetical protein [Thioclava sp. DLFJ4-1]
MSPRDHALQMIRERRAYPVGSSDWEWRTSAARKYIWMSFGIPVNKWRTA